MSTSVQCMLCKNKELLLTCIAYPEGIPSEIVTGQHDHEKPFGGEKERDGKPILFERIKEAA